MKDQLIHMRDKLNNISRSNRSIRLLKLYNKWSFDLSELDPLSNEEIVSASIVEQVIRQSKNEITLLKPKNNDESSMLLSKKLTDLYRNIKDIEKETGIHDFYLGFPFLSGTFSDGTFFQAPLFLYPVRLEKNNTTPQKWFLKLDEAGPQINRTLFLAFKKLNNVSFAKEFFEQAAEQAANDNVHDWISFLKEYEMNVSFTGQGITPLKEYKKEEEPQVAQLTLLEHAVIGNFPQGESSLVKDYEELIALSNDNRLSLVGELIEPLDLEPGHDGEPLSTEPDHNQDLDILTLLQADGSQEEILKEARFRKGLVVHGPPGTGKSQVIVNLIADALHQEKKVLVVCKKPAALDVVYQRLDSLGLSNHVALVHDEKKDREKLYTQIGAVLDQNQVSFENARNQLIAVSNKLHTQEELLNSIAEALYEYQSFGLRLYDLYGMAKPVEDTNQLIDLHEVLPSLNKDKLTDLSEKVYTYAEWFERFGHDDYPLKERKTFVNFHTKDKLEAIELLNDLIPQAKEASKYVHSLDHESITPAYIWSIEDKLDKIYPDLEDDHKSTLQGLRSWWWTSFSGKPIIEKLLDGQKFKGIISAEWLTLKKSLIVMHQLGEVTKKMVGEIEKLKRYLKDSKIEEFKNRISEGDIPLNELNRIMESFHRDFEELQQMDVYWNHCSELEKKVILQLQQKTSNNGMPLSDYWVHLLKNSAYIEWIDQTEKEYPQVQKISTNEFSRIRESFATLIEDKRKIAARVSYSSLNKKSRKWFNQAIQKV